jgi:putative flippase GtrA
MDRRDRIGQSLRFALVAPLVFAADWGGLTLLAPAGAPPLAGRAMSLSASVCVGLLANRFFTFRAAGRPGPAEFSR